MLERAGYIKERAAPQPQSARMVAITHFGFSTAWAQHVLDMDRPTIIPIRDYAEVRRSWMRRSKPVPVLQESWCRMWAWMAQHDDWYMLRIDDEAHRERDLQRIRRVFGSNVVVDWGEKIGHGDG